MGSLRLGVASQTTDPVVQVVNHEEQDVGGLLARRDRWRSDEQEREAKGQPDPIRLYLFHSFLSIVAIYASGQDTFSYSRIACGV